MSHLRVLRGEAEVQRGGELQRVEVPAPLAHEVVQHEDVQPLVRRGEGHHAHVGAPHQLQRRQRFHSRVAQTAGAAEPAVRAKSTQM
jgi:hypothetical protein